MVTVRRETRADIRLIHQIEAAAFNSSIEPTLVDLLRERSHAVLSLVAETDGKLVGHVIYSPVTVTPGSFSCRGLGLGPIAVLPDYQKQGIGTELIQRGNGILAGEGYDFVVLLGNPRYYTRFGFRPGSEFNWKTSTTPVMNSWRWNYTRERWMECTGWCVMFVSLWRLELRKKI